MKPPNSFMLTNHNVEELEKYLFHNYVFYIQIIIQEVEKYSFMLTNHNVKELEKYLFHNYVFYIQIKSAL
jgi:hypothetical protein